MSDENEQHDETAADRDTSAETRKPGIETPGALIFDLDGTLVDTVRERIESWMRTFAEVGMPADRSHVAGLIGADGKRLAIEVAAVAGKVVSEDRAEAIDRRSGEIFSEIASDPRPQPGATQLLRALEANAIPWSIATSSRPEQAQPSVAALELDEPPHLTDGSHVKQAKPAPDLLLYAAEQLSVATHKCWYVGDATWDMRAARSAGMTGIGISSGAVSVDVLTSAGAQLTFHALGELHEELVRRGVLPPDSY